MRGAVELPAVFDEIVADPLRALDRSRAVIGYSCSYLPAPLLSVAGLSPFRLRAAATGGGTPLADTYLSSVICTYPRALLEQALDGGFDFLSGWVFTSCCDHLRRLYDNLEHLLSPGFSHMVDLPHKRGAAAVGWYEHELGVLAAELGRHFGVDTTGAALEAAIEQHNRRQELLGRIAELRKRPAPPISGTDFHKLMVALGQAPPPPSLHEALEELAAELSARSSGLGGYRARLLLAGSMLDDPAYLAIIESVGGLVVADRFCCGSLPGLAPIASDSSKPLRALAEHSLQTNRCPRMMADFELRVRTIRQAAEEHQVDGVIVQIMKFCDLWSVESGPLVAALRRAGLPVLRLEREYARGGEAQLRTRVQAFLESLGK